MSLLIKNGNLVTQNKKREILYKTDLLIEKDKIKKIAKNIRNKVDKIIEADGKVILPGLINTHTHLAMTLLRGYADDLSLEEWWFKRIYPVESKFTRKTVYWGSLLGALELIKSGTTYFVDFYYFPDEVAKIAKKTGIRANLGIGILDTQTFAFKNTKEIIREAERLIKENKNELIDFSLAPHMFQTTSIETYKKAKVLARKYNLILQTHCGETKAEIDFCLKKYKKRPVEILGERKILDEKFLAVHCCHLNQKEIEILAKNKVKVSHCPISNLKLASGIMPFKEMLKKKITIGLGTDSPCSKNGLDLFQEMKVCALIHKIINRDPKIASAQEILDLATIKGAGVIGKEKEIGSLEIGKKADLIILNFNQPHLQPCHHLISHLIYSAKGSDVETSIVNGKIIMENRKILTLDEEKIIFEANQQINKIIR